MRGHDIIGIMHNFQGLYQTFLYNVHFLLHKCLSLHSYFKAKIEPYALHWPTFFGWMKKIIPWIQILSHWSVFFWLSIAFSSSPCYRATQNKCVIWHTSVVSFINAGLSSCVLDSYFFLEIQTNYGKSFAKWFRGFSLGKQEEDERRKKSPWNCNSFVTTPALPGSGSFVVCSPFSILVA